MISAPDKSSSPSLSSSSKRAAKPPVGFGSVQSAVLVGIHDTYHVRQIGYRHIDFLGHAGLSDQFSGVAEDAGARSVIPVAVAIEHVAHRHPESAIQIRLKPCGKIAT